MPDPLDKQHDPRFFELLAEARWLQQLARRLVGDPVEADDVVQETWVAALVDTGRVAGRRAWLAEVARNVVRQRRRSEASRRRREASLARPEARDPEAEAEAVARAEAQRALVDAVLALSEPYRSTVILHYFDHLDVPEVARRNGITESAVRSRLSRAVQELRHSMRREHGERWALVLTPLAPLAPATLVPATPPLESASIDPTSVSPTAPDPLPLLTLMSTNTKLALVATAAACIWILGTTLAPVRELANQDAVVSPTTSRAKEPAHQAAAAAPETSTAGSPTRSAVLEAPPPDDATAATPTALASLEVRVRFADDGTPGAGVGVVVFPWGAPDPFVDRRAARCDEQGVARFERLAPGKASITLDRAASASAVLEAGDHSVVELLVADGADVVGLVVDNDERPVSDARIWLSRYGTHLEGADVTRSDDAGRFAIRDVSDGRHLGARHGALGSSTLQDLPNRSPGQRIEVKLVLGDELTELAGTVRDPSGRALAGADVTVDVFARELPGTPLAGQRRHFAPETARTDGLGRFALHVAPAGRATIVARAPGMAPCERDVQLAAERQELDLVLTPMAVVRGRVVDGDGLPVAGASVLHGRYGGRASAHTNTKDDGTFALTGLPSGGVMVRINAGDRGAVRRTFELSPMAEVEWLVELGAGPGISGRVIDHRDQPIAGLLVSAVDENDFGADRKQTKTDEDGKFELSDWPADANAVFVREPSDSRGEPIALARGVRPGNPIWLELRVAENTRHTAHVVGRVTDSTGTPVAGARVQGETGGPSFGAIADETGRFAFGPVRPGPCLLRVVADGFASVVLRDLELTPSATREVLVRLERPGAVEVSVVLPADWVVDSKDPSWVKGDVALMTEDGWHVSALRLHHGIGRLEAVPPGRYRVQLRSQWLRTDGHVVVEVLPNDVARVELVALRGTSRTVELIDPGLAGPDRVRVLARATDGAVVFESMSTWSPQYLPRFLIYGLNVGTYTIEALTDTGRRASAAIEVDDLGASAPMMMLELE